MAELKAVFQPFTRKHEHVINSVHVTGAVRDIRISSAYTNSAGVLMLKQFLLSHRGKVTAFIGVRNGSTTAQGLAALLKCGVKLYVVDTGSVRRIFHPKFYAVRGESNATVVIGSANLTHAGLNNNIEASASINLDLAVQNDHRFLMDLYDALDRLIAEHPAHCARIQSLRQIVKMKEGGRVEDEDLPRINASGQATGRSGGATTIPPINLPFFPAPAGSRRRRAPSTSARFHFPIRYGQLVWEKPRLPVSDLQLLSGNSHSPGVLRLTQAGFRVDGRPINQGQYFRHNIFRALDWGPGPRGKQVAIGEFLLVIGGVLVGDRFRLEISHKPAWESGQHNYTTGLHWGEAVKYIRRRDFVGRSLKLYAPPLPGEPYVIEID